MKNLVCALLVSASLFAAEDMRLADVKKVYIEKMPNGLDSYLRSALSSEFHDRLTVVLERSKADAILSEMPMGAEHSDSATVNLVDPKGKAVLWSGTAGDRDMKMLGLRHGGEETIADKLASQLKKAMQR